MHDGELLRDASQLLRKVSAIRIDNELSGATFHKGEVALNVTEGSIEGNGEGVRADHPCYHLLHGFAICVRLIEGELAYYEPGNAIKYAGKAEAMKNAFNFVDWLGYVFNNEDGAVEPYYIIRSGGKGVEHCEIAANEWSGNRAGAIERGSRPPDGGHPSGGKNVKKCAVGAIGWSARQGKFLGHGGVDGAEPGVEPEGMERGDIAETDEPNRARNAEFAEQMDSAITATPTKDCTDIGIIDGLLHFGQTNIFRGGIGAGTAGGVWSDQYAETGITESIGGAGDELRINSRSRGYDGDAIAFGQGLWG